MATQYTAQDFTDLLKIPKGYKQFKKYVQTGKGTQAEVSNDHDGALELDFWYEIECFRKDATQSYALSLFNTYPFFSSLFSNFSPLFPLSFDILRLCFICF